MTDIPNSSKTINKNPWAAFFLTLLFPGLGHLYVENRLSALAYALIAIGLWFSYFSTPSFLTRVAILLIFPFVVIPAARDAVAVAQGRKKVVTGEESRVYVVWMLCCAGPFALPLLWQNKKFSTATKVVWTLVVVSIAAVFLIFAASIGKGLEQMTQGS